MELTEGAEQSEKLPPANHSRGSRVARIAPAARRVLSVREEGFRVTMKASCSQLPSQGSEMDEILLSSPIRGPISNPNYRVLPRFTADIQRK